MCSPNHCMSENVWFVSIDLIAQSSPFRPSRRSLVSAVRPKHQIQRSFRTRICWMSLSCSYLVCTRTRSLFASDTMSTMNYVRTRYHSHFALNSFVSDQILVCSLSDFIVLILTRDFVFHVRCAICARDPQSSALWPVSQPASRPSRSRPRR